MPGSATMCGGCGWAAGEYSCTTWLADAVLSTATDPTTLATALRQSALSNAELSMMGIGGAACERLAAAMR